MSLDVDVDLICVFIKSDRDFIYTVILYLLKFVTESLQQSIRNFSNEDILLRYR